LESSLQEEKNKNEKLVKENEELKNRVKCLEAEVYLKSSKYKKYVKPPVNNQTHSKAFQS
jgi:cell division protein FtsB